MKAYDASKIRNVSLLGHSSSGKTMLVESLLYATGAISRMGKVEDGNTVGDFSIEEKQRKVSINTAMKTERELKFLFQLSGMAILKSLEAN